MDNKSLQLTDSLAVRHRPRLFSDIVGNSSNIKTIKGFLQKGQLPRSWLFSGNPGSGKCITSSSLINTPKGIVSIGELVGNDFIGFKEKKIEVYNKLGEVEVTSHVYREENCNTIKITTFLGSSIEGTPEHPLLVYNGQEGFWKKLKEIQKGDILYVVKQVDASGVSNVHFEKVCDVEKQKGVKDVYDLTLPVTHSFIANGFINHNTTSARILAMLVNCENIADNLKKGIIEPCLKCRSCKLALENKHPDIFELNCGSEDGNVQGMRDLMTSIKLAPRFNVKTFILDECLPLDTQVLMTDNSTKTLQEILNNPEHKHVLSYSIETSQVEEDDVEKVWEVGEKEMIEIELEDGSTQRCSVNHKWWSVTRNKYVRADELLEGEELLSLD